jgi:hypothetical protein
MDINLIKKRYELYLIAKMRQRMEAQKHIANITKEMNNMSDKEPSHPNHDGFNLTSKNDDDNVFQNITTPPEPKALPEPNTLPEPKALPEPKIWKQVRNGIKHDKMDNNVLYVTSFNKEMYKMSGRFLIDTFKKFNPKNYMIVYYEGMVLKQQSPQIIPYDLANANFLHEWIAKNARDIPLEYGGTATKQTNPKLFKNYFNKAASLWFRKIVSIESAIKTFGDFFNYVVWIDADCYVKSHLPPHTMNNIFTHYDVIYHLGKIRQHQKLGIESGIIGFKKGKGYNFMNKVANKFRSGAFKKYSRWDDGWVFKEVVKEETEQNLKRQSTEIVKLLDVVGRVAAHKYTRCEVIPHGPFSNFFVHDKGKHNELRGAKIKKNNANKV